MLPPAGFSMPRKLTTHSISLEGRVTGAPSERDARPRRDATPCTSESHPLGRLMHEDSPATTAYAWHIMGNVCNLESRIGDDYNPVIRQIGDYSSNGLDSPGADSPSHLGLLTTGGETLDTRAGADPDRTIALGALSDPVRRVMIERLAEQPSSVGRLASGFPISRAAVSQHLKVLLNAGLVGYRKCGALNVYSVNTEPLLRLRGYLKDLCREVDWAAKGDRGVALELT